MMPQEKGSVRSLGKALELLELLNRSRVPMTLQALSQASGYPKSTIHSLLATLRSYGCIRQESDGRYYLGTKLFEWGCGVSAAWEITRCARPYLERLAQQTQYTALLSCVEGSNIVVIDQRVSGTGIHVASEIGGRTPLHATSQGKLLLSQLPDATVRYLMNGQGMDPFTPHTIVDLATLTEELERIRRVQDRPAVRVGSGVRQGGADALYSDGGGPVSPCCLRGVRGGGGHGLRRRRKAQSGAGLSCVERSAIRNYVLLCEKAIFFCRGRW